MAGSGARRRPQKYPDELRERAVRMVLEIREQSGERQGAVIRVAKELGIGTESLRGGVNRAEIDSLRRPGTSTVDARASRSWSGRTASCAGRMTWRVQAVSATVCA